jgi:hypothetical protein
MQQPSLFQKFHIFTPHPPPCCQPLAAPSSLNTHTDKTKLLLNSGINYILNFTMKKILIGLYNFTLLGNCLPLVGSLKGGTTQLAAPIDLLGNYRLGNLAKLFFIRIGACMTPTGT